MAPASASASLLGRGRKVLSTILDWHIYQIVSRSKINEQLPGHSSTERKGYERVGICIVCLGLAPHQGDNITTFKKEEAKLARVLCMFSHMVRVLYGMEPGRHSQARGGEDGDTNGTVNCAEETAHHERVAPLAWQLLNDHQNLLCITLLLCAGSQTTFHTTVSSTEVG